MQALCISIAPNAYWWNVCPQARHSIEIPFFVEIVNFGLWSAIVQVISKSIIWHGLLWQISEFEILCLLNVPTHMVLSSIAKIGLWFMLSSRDNEKSM